MSTDNSEDMLREAREIAAQAMERMVPPCNPDVPPAVRAGKCDDWPTVHAALAALTRPSSPTSGDAVDLRYVCEAIDYICARPPAEMSVQQLDDAFKRLREIAAERRLSAPRGDGDAVRIAAIEECVKVVGEYISSTDLAAPLNTGPWNAGRLAGAREVLAAIRALSPVSVEGEQGVGEQGGGA